MWLQSRFRSTMLLTMFTYKGPFGLGTLDTACSAASACSAVSSSHTCYWGRIDWMIINWSFSASEAFLTVILSARTEVGWEIQGCILSPDLCVGGKVVVQGCIKACIAVAFLSLWSEVGWEIQGCIFSPDLCVVGQVEVVNRLRKSFCHFFRCLGSSTVMTFSKEGIVGHLAGWRYIRYLTCDTWPWIWLALAVG